MQAQTINAHAQKLTDTQKFSKAASLTSKPATHIESIPAWVDELFLRFSAIYKSKWTQDHINTDFMRLCKWEWANASSLRAINAEELQKSIEFCKSNQEWPPSIHEFEKVVRSVRADIKRKRELEDIQAKRYLAKDSSAGIERSKAIIERLKAQHPNKPFIKLIPLLAQEIQKELNYA